MFRRDGAVFLIETQSHSGWITRHDRQLRRNGQPLERDFIQQTHNNLSWLKKFLKTRAGFEPWSMLQWFSPTPTWKTDLNLDNVDYFQREPTDPLAGNGRVVIRGLPVPFSHKWNI